MRGMGSCYIRGCFFLLGCSLHEISRVFEFAALETIITSMPHVQHTSAAQKYEYSTLFWSAKSRFAHIFSYLNLISRSSPSAVRSNMVLYIHKIQGLMISNFHLKTFCKNKTFSNKVNTNKPTTIPYL